MHLHIVELEGAQEMNIEETARDAAMASVGSKTALTSGGLLAGLGFLSSEWVFGAIGVLGMLAGLGINFYFQQRSRSDRLKKVEEDSRLAKESDRREQELHDIKMQLYLRQLNTGQPGQADAASILASAPPSRPRPPSGGTTDFGGLDD